MKVEKFLTKEELEATQAMHNDFNRLKLQVADAELQKQAALRNIEMLRAEFAKHEKSLMDKYGEDAVINMQTGEVTKK
jgi:hypothetical protein